jgi:hypothetical protein
MEPASTPPARSSTLLNGLRWIGVLPCAALGAWAAWMAITFLNRVTFYWQGLDPESFLPHLYIEGVAHAVLGAAGVYVGAHIAPSHRDIAVFSIAALFVLFAGFALFPAMMSRNWWAVYGGIALAFGAGSVAWSVYPQELSDRGFR